jgi:transmembrane sensor
MDANERRRRASQEAAEWWLRLQTEDIPRADREEFIDWLRESSVHVAEMLRVAQVHGALVQFERWANIKTDGSDKDNIESFPQMRERSETGARALQIAPPQVTGEGRGPRSESPSKRPKRVKFWAIAASAAIFAIASAWIILDLQRQTIQTERGERREVALADGSVVQVDPETRLRIRFEEHTRRVFLQQGRAFFRVAKNPDRPFQVQVDGTTVRAVGTEFGVERQQQGLIVTVAEGKVAVISTIEDSRATQSSPPRPGATGFRSSQERATVLVAAGEQVSIKSSGSAEPVHKVDSGRELAWAEGRLVFDNDDIATVISQFNHYNRVQLHVTDPTLAKRRVSGTFNASDSQSFIDFLLGTTRVRVTHDGDQDITLAPTDTP